MYSLTAIVPFYNEELFMEESINRLLTNDVFDKIILIDDCSTDSSASIAKQFESKNNKISYYKNNNNGGKGLALSTAFKEVSTTHVVIHDADLEYDPKDIKEMKALSIDNPDSLILGSRFIGNKARKNLYTRTYIANKVMSIFFSFVNFYNISDVATCYKLMPSEFIKTIKLKESGFSIEIEMLSEFLKFNRSVIESPISYAGRSYEEGKKIKTVDGFLYLLNTVKYRIFN